MGSSITIIYEMQETHSLYWQIELSGLMQNKGIFFATSNLQESPVAEAEVEAFDIEVNSMVLEQVVELQQSKLKQNLKIKEINRKICHQRTVL